MSHRMIILALVLIPVALTGIACQKAQKEEPQAIVESEVWVLPDSMISEQVWLYFTDKPQEYFEKTLSDLDAENPGLASYDLRTAAAYMKIEAERAQGNYKKALKASIDEVEHAAGLIEDGTDIETGDLTRMFARAHYALAQHHLRRASAYWKRNDEIKAGEALDVAANHVKDGMGWVTEESSEVETPAMKKVFETAGEMTEGKIVKPEAVSEAMKALEGEIADFHAKLEAA
jgi:hypothetical protein